MPPGVKIIGSCEYHRKEVCSVKCEKNKTTVWKKEVKCMENGQWSPLPTCFGVSTVESLEVVNCDKIPVDLQGKGFCLKISRKNPRKNRCPELFNVKLTMKECTREPGTDCLVSCGHNYIAVRCLPNGRWSHTPNCTASEKKVCPEPEFGTLVNCSRREGELCKVWYILHYSILYTPMVATLNLVS